jgi:hypothetical protein
MAFHVGQISLVCSGKLTKWSQVPGNEMQAPAPKAPALPPSSPTRLDSGNVDGNYFVNCSILKRATSSGIAYYAQLNPGHNVGHRPNRYVDVNNSTYINWTHPDSGMTYGAVYHVLNC